MIEIKNVYKDILNNINLTLPSRGFIVITGPSGSGKSTLINLITGQKRRTKGKVLFFGEKINRFNNNKINALYIGEVFQKPYLFDNKSVYENIEISLKIINLLESFERKVKVDYILKELDLEKYKNTLCKNLSFGEKMKVQIARALVKNPKVLVLDEPTAPLDKKSSFKIFSLLKDISKQKLVIMVSHDKLYTSFADRIIYINNGKIIKDEKNILKNKPLEFDGEINLNSFNDKKKCDDITMYGKPNSKITIVFKDENIYIKTKYRVIDNIKMLNYAKMEYSKIKFENLDNSLNDIKYSSIYRFSDSIKNSLKEIYGYYKNRKVLIIGLFFSCFIIIFSLSTIFAKIKTNKMIYYNKNYIRIINKDDVLKRLKPLKPSYIIPENYIKSFKVVNNDLYKLNFLSLTSKGAFVKNEKQTSGTVIMGKRLALDLLNNKSNLEIKPMININNINNLLNKYIIVDGLILKVVEIKNNSNSIEISSDDFDELFSLKNIKPISKYMGRITLLEGHLPVLEDDCIVSDYNMNVKCNIVGKYNGDDKIIVSDKTYEKKYYDKVEYFVYVKNKNKFIKKLNKMDITYYDDYKINKKINSNKKIKSIKSNLRFLTTFLIISIIIIYFIIKMIVMNNVTNIGLYRLLKTKNRDIYFSILTRVYTFIGSISILSCIFIIIFLKELTKISILKKYFVINIRLFLLFNFIIFTMCFVITICLVKKIVKKDGLDILN